MNLRRLLVAVLTASLLAACGDDADNRREIAGADLIRLGDQVFVDHGTVDARGRDELRMEAGLFSFEPTFVRRSGTAGHAQCLQRRRDERPHLHASCSGNQPGHPAKSGGTDRGDVSAVRRAALLLQVPCDPGHEGRATRRRRQPPASSVSVEGLLW